MRLTSRLGAVLLGSLCSVGYASESGDLLDGFNQLSISGPVATFEVWDGLDSADSEAFKKYYSDHFRLYGDAGLAVADRARACATGELTSTNGYQASYDVVALFETARDQLTRIDNQLLLWQSFNDQGARSELDRLLPPLSISFSKAAFELSSCSGYLSGELVN